MLAVRGLEHRLARLGIGIVLAPRSEIDRRKLPAFERIGQPFGKPFLLLRLVASQPVFENSTPSSTSICSNFGAALRKAATCASDGASAMARIAGRVPR